MSDLISRQAAIDAADAVWSVTGDKNVAKVWDQIKNLPSAQPIANCISETSRQRTFVHGRKGENMDDLISRQAAIDALNNALILWSCMTEWRDNKIRKAIMDVPSAQPEER